LFTKDKDYNAEAVVNELGQRLAENSNDSDEITKDEVIQAIKKLKNGKSPGVDNIPGELIKYGGESMINVMFKLFKQIWRMWKVTNIWTKSILILLPKKRRYERMKRMHKLSYNLTSMPC